MSEGRIVYGSPYSKVRRKALDTLNELNNEYRKNMYISNKKYNINYENLSNMLKIIQLYITAIMDAGDSFGYISLFMMSQKNECKKALRACLRLFNEHPELTINMNNVSSFMGTILWNQFEMYSEKHEINYTVKSTNTDKMIASANYGVTTDGVVRYLKKHRIPFELFEGCITIQ